MSDGRPLSQGVCPPLVQGVSLPTASSMEVQGVSSSTAISMDVYRVYPLAPPGGCAGCTPFHHRTGSMDVQGVSLSTASVWK